MDHARLRRHTLCIPALCVVYFDHSCLGYWTSFWKPCSSPHSQLYFRLVECSVHQALPIWCNCVIVVHLKPPKSSWWYVSIFFISVCSGEGKGEFGATGRAGRVFFIENPRRGIERCARKERSATNCPWCHVLLSRFTRRVVTNPAIQSKLLAIENGNKGTLADHSLPILLLPFSAHPAPDKMFP